MIKSIVISLRFVGSLRQEATIKYFDDFFKFNYGKLFDELHYTITDKTKFNWKQKTKGGKYTPNLFEKYKEALGQSNEKILIDFELLSTLKNYDYKSRDIDLSISFGQEDEIKSLNVILNSTWQEELDIKEFSISICNLLLNQNCNIYYGFVFEMLNKKMPSFYAQGIKTENLTKEEEIKLQKWSSGRNNCDKKIWDIFWGNIISKIHIENIQLEDLENIVGTQNTRKISADLLWFNLPQSINEYEISNKTEVKEKLFGYFQNNNITM